MSDVPTTAVVGGGALGLLYAAALAGSGSEPPVLATRRRSLVDAVAAEGITVDLEGASLRAAPGAVVASLPESAAAHGPRDVVLVLARSFESEYAVEVAESLAGPDGVIVMLQNGLTGWDCARRSTRASVSGATYVGAWASANGQVACTRVAPTVLPDADHRARPEQVDAIRTLFAHTPLPLVTAGSERDVVWRKTAVTALNWICGAVGLPVDIVRDSGAWEDAVGRLLCEVAAAARAEGATVDAAEIVAGLGSLPSPPGSKGSAYSTLERGQQLEVVEICDSVVRRGDVAGVDVPLTRLVASLARIQERCFPLLPRVAR